MATQHGVHGVISGKIGNLVYYNYRGKQMVRSMPRKSKRLPTVAQQIQQMRFRVTVSFFSALKSLICKGYGQTIRARSGTNRCIAYHLTNSLTGTFPNISIDCSKVVLSRGRLLSPHSAQAFSNDVATVSFSWEYTRSGWEDPSDEAILVTYHTERQQHVWLRTSVNREDEFATLPVPQSFSDDVVHCWIAFISQDEKHFSDSIYLGTVTIK